MGHTVPKMAKLFIVVFSLGLISACVGQVQQNVQCDINIPVLTNFNPTTYAGTWYDIQSVDSSRQTGTCNIHSWTNVGTNINLRNSQVLAGVLQSVTATAAITTGQTAGTAKYTVTYNSGTGAPTTEDYWVLDTDYDSFALVYSCRNVGTTSEVSIWKLGRNPGPLPDAANVRINAIINAWPTLASVNFVTRSHTAANCYATIELPGACPTVGGVAEFNVNNFLGTWHEYSRLPNQVQTGQCSRAEYATGATANVVNVVNTEVNGGVLSTTTGTATTTAQSGILQVTLNVGTTPVNSQLHILATDYVNYALVYSCSALPDTRRRISSWLLRKTDTVLNEDQNTVINDAINAIDGLERVYYQETSHTSEACIHYPALDPQSNTVELRGPCATVTGLANFNVNAFLGRWHELERYPNGVQAGQCSRAEYTATATAGVINIENSEVNGGALSTTSGVARTTAQSGVLQVELNVGGVITPTNLHVLATDYDSYALVYSCVNVPGNNRRVSSWKLSKSTEPLTAIAITAIDAAIAATQGLDNRYYRETSHTSDACIHYPVLNPLPGTIELRGPCATVTPVQNFNLNAFLGNWYEFARYPNEAQSGQCNRAEYVATDAADVIAVENNEVNNEALSTILGNARPTAQAGVLQVELNVEGITRTTNLHVLATDHTSYALVYSCVNIPGNDRRVSSWKLSKSTNPLTAAANTAIDAVIATTQGLDNRYYQETSQSDAACFYYPDYVTLPDTIELRGSCPTIAGMANFNVNAFLGTWHEAARYPNEEQAGQCSRAEYVAGATANVVNIMNSEVNGGALSTTLGTATTTAQSGVLQVELNVGGVITPTTLHVLATDYDSYALVYSCVNVAENRRRVSSWKLSKSTDPLTAAANTAINTVIAATQGLDNRYYQETSHTSDACIHYPEFETLPNTIELRGPCAAVTGVTDFNVNLFIGTWHEFARYPNEVQTGQCNRAEYATTTTAGVISVENSEVIDETLSTILGNARTTAQTGVLQIELNVGGGIRTTNLHVLATDHTSYALLYSCVNVPGNNRRVSSWKLSKSTDPLTAAANTAINAVIATTQGLDNRYYQETSQSDAACFYYPEYVILPDTIELRGSCPTINGVPNFNLNDYLGIWHEVARYPQPTQTGQCNRAEYSPAATTGFISVVNSQVNNEALNSISGQARQVDQTGRLEVLFTVGGEPRVSEIYVLATDYVSYALVYNCVNVPGNRRRVGSWKLSKTADPLTNAANTVINAVIAATQGLDNRYYQETSQSNAACFYYPEFETLPSSIELRGPCPTIAPVQNFDLPSFLGTWYEVARYPQERQTGQCNRAVYETVEGGGVSVVNSQVTNELLATISGEVRTTDQLGILEVVFTVGDETRTSNLHVLETDYTNYALLYSCINIEGNRRRVGSWKLSRNTSPLVDESNEAIDAVISATQGLNENYYQTTSQNDTACFHYPVQTGEKVIIPGQCDTTISGVANIDLTRFTNELVWYQIRRYDAVVGTCIGTRLTLDEDYINLNHIERVGDEVKRLTGIARLSSIPDGKFTYEMEDSDDQEEIQILATDYDGFAIAYNCKNVGPNERQIGAWQLSRERTMPTAGETAVQQLINSRPEFTERESYFKEILHPSPAGDECPEPSSGFLFKSSIIVICVCALLQLVW